MRTLLGVGLIATGGVVMYGAVTGRLAPMLAAMFTPNALEVKQ